MYSTSSKTVGHLKPGLQLQGLFQSQDCFFFFFSESTLKMLERERERRERPEHFGNETFESLYLSVL